jgi:hypothetical protein
MGFITTVRTFLHQKMELFVCAQKNRKVNYPIKNEEILWKNVLVNAQESTDLWECLLRTTG